MPVRDGFELVEELQKKQANVYIIFITAFEKYAIKAIKASAIDYLLKPVKKSELLGSMEKAMEKVKDSGMTNKYSKLLKQLSGQKRLLFRNRTGFSVFDADEIIYCQADSNYSVLKLDSGRDHLVSMNLGKVEQILPADTFCRISRSLVVNINFLKEVDRKSMKCILDGSSPVQLDISKKYLKLLEQACESGFNLKDL